MIMEADSASNENKFVSTTTKSSSMTGTTTKQRTPSPMIAVKRVIGHLRNAKRDVRRQYDALTKFYAKEQMLLRNVFNYESLPKEHYKWFDINIRHFDKYKKVTLLLPVLLDSLKTFQSTFKQMLTFDLKVHHTVSASCDRHNERIQILEKIANSSNVTCFEVETEMCTLKLSTQVTINVTQEKGNRWVDNPDYTTTMVQDWGVITTYYRFLKDWLQITGHIYKEFCDEKSWNHKCRKFLKYDSSSTPMDSTEIISPKARQSTISL